MKYMIFCLTLFTAHANTLSWSLSGGATTGGDGPNHLYHAGADYDLGNGIDEPRFLPRGTDWTISGGGGGLFIQDEDVNRYQWHISGIFPDFGQSFSVQ